MHEFSLAQALLEEIDRVRLEHGTGRLTAFRVEIGELSGVEPELLLSAVEVLLEGNGPMPQVDRVPLEARCEECMTESTIINRNFRCLTCGGSRLTILRGDGLILRDVTFEMEEVCP